jgi:hypothetical protein
MEKYADEHGLLFGGGEPWEQEILDEEVIFGYVRDKIAYFKSLPAPPGDDEKGGPGDDRSLRRRAQTSEATPASLAEARPGMKELPNPFERSYETTTAYGPWLCGQP